MNEPVTLPPDFRALTKSHNYVMKEGLASYRQATNNSKIETVIPWDEFPRILHALGITDPELSALSKCKANYSQAYKVLELTYGLNDEMINKECFRELIYAVSQTCKGQSLCIVVTRE